MAIIKGTPLLIPPIIGGIQGGQNPASGGMQVDSDDSIKNALLEKDLEKMEVQKTGIFSNSSTSLDKKSSQNTIKYSQKEIEKIKPGEFVFGHDGEMHRVLKIFKRLCNCILIGIVIQEDQILWVTENHLILSERKVKRLTPSGGWSGIPKHHFERARSLRKQMTPPERKLWKYLKERQAGVKFRRQHPIGPYIVDFYSRDCGLVVEIDGKQHFEPQKQEYDKKRDDYLKSLGLEVLRISAHEVYKNINGVLKLIYFKSKQKVPKDENDKQWIYAGVLNEGDIIYCGIEKNQKFISKVLKKKFNGEVFDLEVEKVNSYFALFVPVHGCN